MRYAAACAMLVLVVLAAGPARCSESITIAVLDVKRVIEESKYSADFETKIRDFARQTEAEYNDFADGIKKEVETIQTGMRLLSPEAQQAEQLKIKALAQQLQEARDAALKAVRQERAGYAKQLEEMMQQAVEEVATEESIHLVINSMAVLYKTEVRDITDLVVAKLDTRFNEEHGVSDTPTEPATEPATDSATKGGE